MEEKTDYKKIARYLAGECSIGEVKEIEDRMKNDPEYAEMIRNFQKIWNAKKIRTRAWDIEGVWGRLSREMEEDTGKIHQARSAEIRSIPERTDRVKTHATPQGSGVHWIVRIAATLLVVGFTSLFTILYLNTSVENDENFMKEVVTERGQRATIQLDDGSRIRLNSGSILRHPEEFDEDERSVHLAGEAYFEIASDGRPFIVFADEAVIEVLGTEFNVQAYKEDNIEVVVAGGKVAVRSGSNSKDDAAHLEQGDMASLQRDNDNVGTVSVIRHVDLTRHLGWLDYRLTFDNTPMEDVARKLERWYGVDIIFSDQGIAEMNVSVTFEDESIQEVLRVLDIALNLNHEIEGRSITFSRGTSEL